MTILSVGSIADAISASFISRDDANDARHEKFLEAIKMNNGGLVPVVGASGRMHAPCNGYTGVCGHVYLQGQFIPYLGSEYEGDESIKIRIKGEEFINALRACDDPRISSGVGTQWQDADGTMTANLYIEVAKGYEDTVSEVVSKVMGSFGVEKVSYNLDGKQDVSGVICGFWQKTSEYGVQEGFSVRTEGGAIYKGTLPKSVHHAEVGDIICFTATYTKGSSYFKRPCRATLSVTEESISA